MTAPTKASRGTTIVSLQKELAGMRSRLHAAQQAAHERQRELVQICADLAPLLAYLQSGWLGPVQGNYQRLKVFAEGK